MYEEAARWTRPVYPALRIDTLARLKARHCEDRETLLQTNTSVVQAVAAASCGPDGSKHEPIAERSIRC